MLLTIPLLTIKIQKRYRADNLIEDYITKCENILKEQKKQEKDLEKSLIKKPS